MSDGHSFDNLDRKGMDMIAYIRTIFILAIGLMPFLLYQIGDDLVSGKTSLAETPTSSVNAEPEVDLALVEMNRAVESKARELHEIDVKILESKGSILKMEENKHTFLRELEAIQTQIQRVIKGAKTRKE